MKCFIPLLVYSKRSIIASIVTHSLVKILTSRIALTFAPLTFCSGVSGGRHNMPQTGPVPKRRKSRGTVAVHQSVKNQNKKDMSSELFLRSVLRGRRRSNKFLNFSLISVLGKD